MIRGRGSSISSVSVDISGLFVVQFLVVQFLVVLEMVVGGDWLWEGIKTARAFLLKNMPRPIKPMSLVLLMQYNAVKTCL